MIRIYKTNDRIYKSWIREILHFSFLLVNLFNIGNIYKTIFCVIISDGSYHFEMYTILMCLLMHAEIQNYRKLNHLWYQSGIKEQSYFRAV